MILGDSGRKTDSAITDRYRAIQTADSPVTALFQFGGEECETICTVQGLAYGRCAIQGEPSIINTRRRGARGSQGPSCLGRQDTHMAPRP